MTILKKYEYYFYVYNYILPRYQKIKIYLLSLKKNKRTAQN